MRKIVHFIAGKDFEDSSENTASVFAPNTGEVQAEVSLANTSTLAYAIETAQAAQVEWAATNPQRRARVMFKFKELVEANRDRLAALLSSEHGKVLVDAQGDIQRGLEVIEFACGIPHAQKGEYTEGAGPGIDVYSMRQALGVVAGITPFNFPAMIPMWMFGVAIACGNAFILKPSERDPSVPVELAKLMIEAGLPAGVLNVVHGNKEVVDGILDHQTIKAVSFVGSSDIANYVYERGARAGKRVQAMGGAKNHGIVMPDADLDMAASALMGAAYGSAGERCMAISVAVPVTDAVADALIERLVPQIEALKIGPASDRSSEMGPLVTQAARDRANHYVDLGEQQGARVVVDGRGFQQDKQGYENGFYVGGTLLDHVTEEMDCYRDEIFGPVLSVVRKQSYQDAVDLIHGHNYANGTAIFTRDGDVARAFSKDIEVGMVGINVPIPVPMAYHSFGGWKSSIFGEHHMHGMEGVRFYTRIKTTTTRWPSGMRADPQFTMPTLG